MEGASLQSVPGGSDRDVLWQAANAFRTTQALYVVAKLGIADLLRDGPKTSEELAQRAKAHPRSLFRLLRYLAGLGFFTQDKSNRFGLTPKSEDPRQSVLVVAEAEGQTFCLLVDEVIGKQEVVIKTLGETFANSHGIAGGAILGDGRVGLILEMEKLFKERGCDAAR